MNGYAPAVISVDEFNATHSVHRLGRQEPPREYVVHAPAGWNGCTPLPLLLMIHGGGGTPRTAAYATGASRVADARTFLVVYPAALPRNADRPVSFLRNPTFWNVGSGFGHAERLQIDDVAYIAAVFDDVAQRYPIDRGRVFVAGFSNGAALALRVAVDLSDRLSAVTAIAGHLWRRDRRPARPVSLLFMAGTADPIVPPAGGLVHSPWGKDHLLPPVRDTVVQWADWLEISAPPRVSMISERVQVEEFGPGALGATVRFITIEGAGHVWPGGPSVLNEKISGPQTTRFDATAAMVEFFGL